MSRIQRLFTMSTLFIASTALLAEPDQVATRQEGPLPPNESRAALAETADAVPEVNVFFATNRQRKKIDKPGVRFGGKRGEPAFGTCTVEFEPIPGMEEVAQKVPFYVPTESSVLGIEIEADPDLFWKRLASTVEATESGDVVVFIHGYSYDLERGCDRAAQAQRFLDGEATLLLFTWPSNGRATDYASDRKDLEWSVPFLMTILRELVDRFGAENVQVLAHSLGSRGIVEALMGLKNEGMGEPLMDRLVLLAPDIGSARFLEALPDLRSLTGDITLYASSNDTPLKFSRQVNRSPRLGQAGDFLTVAEGMETVDVTPAGRYQYLGYEYFYFHPDVAADLFVLLSEGKSAAERPGLRQKTKDGLSYWEVVGEN